MGFIVPFVAPAMTAAAGYLGYQTAQAALDAATQVGIQALKQQGQLVVRLGANYVTSEILSWSCKSSTEYLKQNCAEKIGLTDFDCQAMLIRKAASCFGSSAVTVMGVYEAGTNALPIPNK